MGEMRGKEPQLPADGIRAAEGAGLSADDAEVFEQGIAAGREWARKATQRTLAWVEENPGSALLVASGMGFVLGKLLLRRRRFSLEDLTDD
jgi:ElaB/YqjD/DUF883 family membrane-anchored ribosome-binding protein